MKSVLIICYSNHFSEPRLLKEVHALKSDFKITTAGFRECNVEGVQFVNLTMKRKKLNLITFHLNWIFIFRVVFSLINFVLKHWHSFINGTHFSQEDYNLLVTSKHDLIIAHHPDSLELASKLKRNYKCPLILNCHEYYPLEFDNDKMWMQEQGQIVHELLLKFANKVDLWLTVGPTIDSMYQKNFNAKTMLFYNNKPYYKLIPGEMKDVIRIIHHGAAMPERKLENTIEAFLKLPEEFELYLMLVPLNKDYNDLLIQKYGYHNRIHFLPIVKTEEIPNFINQFDIGLFFLGEEIFNYKYCLPNKLFEFIQARLCVVVTPNPEMKELVERFSIGRVAKSYSDFDCIEAIKSLSREQIMRYKINTERAASELDSRINEEEFRNKANELCVV